MNRGAGFKERLDVVLPVIQEDMDDTIISEVHIEPPKTPCFVEITDTSQIERKSQINKRLSLKSLSDRCNNNGGLLEK